MEIELVFPKKFGCVGAVDVPSLYFVVPVQVAQERLRVHRCFRFSVYTAYDVGSVYFFALQDGCVACIVAIVECGCLTNAEELENLMDIDFLYSLAEGIAEGILKTLES